jgi:plasmid stabilization system protein ParE
MANVQLSQRARNALRRIILDRRERVGFLASRALYQRIMGRIYRLRDFPDLGRIARMADSPLLIIQVRATLRA